MASNRRILCVDDEPNVLEALERTLGESFSVVTMTRPKEALEALVQGDFAVVMSDMRMPGMSGAELLAHARQSAPHTTRVLLTGQADIASAAAAINDGAIFQFLVKPCPSESISKALEAAIEQHHLVTAERELLDRTLTSIVKLLTDVLAMASPTVFERSNRLQRYVVHMAKALALAEPWQYEVAASLSQLGCMALPDDLLEKSAKGARLTSTEQATFDSHGEIAHRLLVGIPRLSGVASIILAQRTRGRDADPVAATGARLLRIAGEFDTLIQQGKTVTEAHGILAASCHPDDRTCVAPLATAAGTSSGAGSRPLKLHELQTGMIFDGDVRAHNGSVLLRSGTEVSTMVLERLARFAAGIGVVQPFQVRNAA